MDHANTFSYTYRAPENLEVLNIRKKYLLLDEQHPSKRPGAAHALCTGIGGALFLGLIGAVGMLLAYPMYLK